MKKTAILFLLAGLTGAVHAKTLQADAPTLFNTGATIPAAMQADLRGTLWMKPVTGTIWTSMGTTTNATMKWVIAEPTMGLWEYRATARFLNLTNTESAYSLTMTETIYGIPMPPTNLHIVIGAIIGLVSLIAFLFSRKQK